VLREREGNEGYLMPFAAIIGDGSENTPNVRIVESLVLAAFLVK
jgi:hypothetical protein